MGGFLSNGSTIGHGSSCDLRRKNLNFELDQDSLICYIMHSASNRLMISAMDLDIANFGLSTNIVYKISGDSGLRYRQPLINGVVPDQISKLSKL